MLSEKHAGKKAYRNASEMRTFQNLYNMVIISTNVSRVCVPLYIEKEEKQLMEMVLYE